MNRHRETDRQTDGETDRQTADEQTHTETGVQVDAKHLFNCVFVDDKISRMVKVAKGCRD